MGSWNSFAYAKLSNNNNGNNWTAAHVIVVEPESVLFPFRTFLDLQTIPSSACVLQIHWVHICFALNSVFAALLLFFPFIWIESISWHRIEFKSSSQCANVALKGGKIGSITKGAHCCLFSCFFFYIVVIAAVSAAIVVGWCFEPHQIHICSVLTHKYVCTIIVLRAFWNGKPIVRPPSYNNNGNGKANRVEQIGIGDETK